MDEEKKTQGEEIPGKAEAEGPAAEDRRTTDTPDVQTDAPQTAQTNAAPEDESEDDEGGEGRKVAPGVQALAVPGSMAVREMAEAEGIAKILSDAGFEWRLPGCSMCLAMNDDRAEEGSRVASTSNRNFVGRQGKGSRTHLMSPASAAAAAIAGAIADPRDYL